VGQIEIRVDRVFQESETKLYQPPLPGGAWSVMQLSVVTPEPTVFLNISTSEENAERLGIT
jgi:hypothetical protein